MTGLDRDALDRYITDSRYSQSRGWATCSTCKEETAVFVESEYGGSEWSPEECKHCGKPFTGEEPWREDEPPEPEPPEEGRVRSTGALVVKPPPTLAWARTGAINSRAHIAVSEAWQNVALCGAGITLAGEITPRRKTWCPICSSRARALGVDPAEIGMENDLVSGGGQS